MKKKVHKTSRTSRTHNKKKFNFWKWARKNIFFAGLIVFFVIGVGTFGYVKLHQTDVLGASTIAMLYTGHGRVGGSSCQQTINHFCLSGTNRYCKQITDSCTGKKPASCIPTNNYCNYYNPTGIWIKVVSQVTGKALPGVAVTVADQNGTILNGTNGPKKQTTDRNGNMFFRYTKQGPLTVWIEAQNTSSTAKPGSGHYVSNELSTLVDAQKKYYPNANALPGSTLVDCGSNHFGDSPCTLQVRDTSDYSIYPNSPRTIFITSASQAPQTSQDCNSYYPPTHVAFTTNYQPALIYRTYPSDSTTGQQVYGPEYIFTIFGNETGWNTYSMSSIKKVPGTFYQYNAIYYGLRGTITITDMSAPRVRSQENYKPTPFCDPDKIKL